MECALVAEHILLVLLDIGLPGMDGLDALRHFQAEAGVPVVFLTARRRDWTRCWAWNWVLTIMRPSPST